MDASQVPEKSLWSSGNIPSPALNKKVHLCSYISVNLLCTSWQLNGAHAKKDNDMNTWDEILWRKTKTRIQRAELDVAKSLHAPKGLFTFPSGITDTNTIKLKWLL